MWISLLFVLQCIQLNSFVNHFVWAKAFRTGILWKLNARYSTLIFDSRHFSTRISRISLPAISKSNINAVICNTLGYDHQLFDIWMCTFTHSQVLRGVYEKWFPARCLLKIRIIRTGRKRSSWLLRFGMCLETFPIILRCEIFYREGNSGSVTQVFSMWQYCIHSHDWIQCKQAQYLLKLSYPETIGWPLL